VTGRIASKPMVTAAPQLARRCADLGVPVWQYDATGRIISEPDHDGAWGRWLRSEAIRGRVESAGHAWSEQSDPASTSLLAGAWLIPLVHRHGTRRIGLTAALAISPGFTDSAEFEACCGRAGVNRAMTAQQAMRRATIDVESLETILRWSHDDLSRAVRDEQTLDQFSDNLAYSYEEINLLYGLGRSMNQITDPQRFFAPMLEELHENLPFGWLAVRFDGSRQVEPSLADRLFVCGSPPCDREAFDASTRQALQRVGVEQRSMPGSETDDGLGSLVGAEVVINPLAHDGRVVGVLLAGNKGGDDAELSSVETKLLDAAADFISIYHENAARYAEQHTLFLGTLQALAASIDAKDRYTCGHSERVAFLAQQLALAAGMGEQAAEQYRVAGLVHDVGKIGVPEAVLCKEGQLTDDEFEQIKRHPVIGYEILRDIPPLEDMLPGVRHHHERWDGRGYPQQLSGQDIPMIARVLAVADTFDAMSSTRSYRPARPRRQVLDEIARCAATQFDPHISPLILDVDLAGYDDLMAAHQRLTGFAA